MNKNILEKKSIAHSPSASVIKGQRVHISIDIDGEKKVMYETISKTSSRTSAEKYWIRQVHVNFHWNNIVHKP